MNGADLSPIIRHYDSANERERLWTDIGRLERARTVELIERHIVSPPAVVLDVGGGAGEYSTWLGSMGYETHLVDLVPAHVEQALERSEAEGGTIASCSVGDARMLARSDESVDCVLLMGPLYHLAEHADRQACLSEALRVLRPGGTLIAAAISRYASLLDGLRMGRLDEQELRDMVARDLGTGVHVNPTGEPELFTTARLHAPDELSDELSEGGFDLLHLYGVEGPAWLLADFEARWDDPAGRDQIMWAARQAESEPSFASLSAHLLAVAVKAF